MSGFRGVGPAHVVLALAAVTSGFRPAWAAAQTLPIPTLPEPVAEATEGGGQPSPPVLDALGAAAGERPRPWDYGLGIGVGWDSNIDFVVPDGPSSWGVSPRANLARTFWSSRGQVRLAGDGSWTGYTEYSDLSRYDVTFSLDGTYRSSLNTTWRASGSYSLGYGDSSAVLSDQSILLPRVFTKTGTGTAGVTRKLGPRTSLRVDARAYRTDFDEDIAAGLGLIDGRSYRGTLGLERRLGQRDSAALEYSLEAARARPTVDEEERFYYLTHFASLQWTHLIDQRSGFLLEAGSSYTPDAERAGLDQKTRFYGGASYTRQVGRASTTLYVRREVLPAFGLGLSRLEDRFGGDIALPMGRNWRLGLRGSYALAREPLEAPVQYGDTADVFGTLARRIGRLLELSAEGRYRWRGEAAGYPEIEAYRAGLFVSLVRP